MRTNGPRGLVLTNHVEAAVFSEPVRSKVAPVARTATGVRVVVVAVACKQAVLLQPLPRIPHIGTGAANQIYPRGRPVRSTCAALVAVACTPTHSRPVAVVVKVLVAAEHTVPLAREPLEARTAAAVPVRPRHNDVPSVGTLKTDPAAARAAVG